MCTRIVSASPSHGSMHIFTRGSFGIDYMAHDRSGRSAVGNTRYPAIHAITLCAMEALKHGYRSRLASSVFSFRGAISAYWPTAWKTVDERE